MLGFHTLLIGPKATPPARLVKLRFDSAPAALILSIVPLLLSLPGCTRRPAAEPTCRMDAAPEFWLRVLLHENITDCNLQIPSAFTAIDRRTNAVLARFSADQSALNIHTSAGLIRVGDRSFNCSGIVICPETPNIFGLNSDYYRGNLEIIAAPDSNSFAAVNHVPVEPYLAGVIAAEMPDYWEPAALKAQTIAARSYCLYIKQRFGAGRDWDLRRTQANQVYLGLKAESAAVWSAVNSTCGQVLFSRLPEGAEALLPAYYSSVCAGHTEDSRNVFGDFFESLAGVPCPYCRTVAKPQFLFWPDVEFNKPDLTAKLFQRYPRLARLERITAVQPSRQSDYEDFSRLTMIKLTGSNAIAEFLRAEDFRLAVDPTGFKFRSAACRIVDTNDKLIVTAGRGFGHGVGLCQCGAQAMARIGKTAEEILGFYYPNSKIVKIY